MSFAHTLLAAGTAMVATGAASAVSFDQNVTPDVIFGSGNDNGAFTVETVGSLELGLRAKLRFDSSNQPQNTFNSNGDGSYSFEAGLPPTGFGFAPNSPSSAIWNFEWSINTDADGSSGAVLNDYTYEIRIDFDPGVGVTNFQTFDPINQTFADHAIGTNATGNGAGTVAGDAAGYAALISANNVAQNSWNMEFFDSGSFPFFGGAVGEYTIELEAFDASASLGTVSIDVISVPSPVGAGIGLLGVSGLIMGRRRHQA